MPGKKKHILVVSQYFHPEQFRINDICTEWVKRGYKVTVLTGIPNYPQGKFYDGYGWGKKRKEEWNGIHIIRLPLIARGHNSIGLALNYLSFVISGRFWSWLTKLDADIVFNYEVSPMTQVLVGIWYAKKRKIPCYLYVTDLWPDNVEIVTGIHNKQFLGSINSMVNYIYKRCTRIFTSSESFIRKMVERGVSIDMIEFWPQYAEDFYTPYRTDDKVSLGEETGIPADDKLNILFAGNIGYAQGLGILVKAALQLKDIDCNVRFNIVGNGRYKQEMINEVSKKSLTEYFNFIDSKPATDIPKYMSASDVALICLSKSEVFAMTIPAKTQSCLACGKPILVSADGEVREIVEKGSCGLTSSSEDVEGLVKNIKRLSEMSKEDLELLGQNSLVLYNQKFNKKYLLNMMDKYLDGRAEHVAI